MGESVAIVIAVAGVAAWLTSAVVAFRKRRPWAGLSGLAAPFFLAGVFIWGLGSCLSGPGDCSTENRVTFWAILLALGMVVWAVAAALVPRPGARDSARVEAEASTFVERSQFDRALAGWGLIVAGAGAAIGAWSIASVSPSATWTDRGNLIAVGCSVVCVVGLVLVTARHCIYYPNGPGRWWLTVGWIAAAITLAYVAYPGPFLEEDMPRIGESSPFIAAALAMACLGLLDDSLTLNRKTVPPNRPLSTP